MSFWAQFLPAACVHSDGKPVDGRETVYYSRGAYLGMASRCGRTMERRKAIYRRCVRWVLFLGCLGIWQCPAAARVRRTVGVAWPRARPHIYTCASRHSHVIDTAHPCHCLFTLLLTF